MIDECIGDTSSVQNVEDGRLCKVLLLEEGRELATRKDGCRWEQLRCCAVVGGLKVVHKFDVLFITFYASPSIVGLVLVTAPTRLVREKLTSARVVIYTGLRKKIKFEQIEE